AFAGTLFFGCLAALCFVFGRRPLGGHEGKGWSLSSSLTGGVVALFYLATVVVTFLDMGGIWKNAPGGLLERIALIVGFSWVVLLACHLLREKPLADISFPASGKK